MAWRRRMGDRTSPGRAGNARAVVPETRERAMTITTMAAHDIEPGRSPRGVACPGHVFAADVRADPRLVWTALTDPARPPGIGTAWRRARRGFPATRSSSASAAAAIGRVPARPVR
jgi:hypothetical protein